MAGPWPNHGRAAWKHFKKVGGEAPHLFEVLRGRPEPHRLRTTFVGKYEVANQFLLSSPFGKLKLLFAFM